MTWAHTLTSGSGKLAYRLEIEGMPYCFVTDPALERAAIPGDTNGQAWYKGLLREGLQIDEQADIPNATIKSGGFVARIADINLRGTECFARSPTRTMYLTADLLYSDTSMDVNATTGFSTNDVVHIGTEAIKLSNTSNPATVVRGFWGTVAQSHYYGDGAELRVPGVTDFPVALEGRRARLYAYGEGDSFTGTGTLIYIGICAGEATLSEAMYWEVRVDSLVRLFDQNIGNSSDEPMRPRGIYHPWNSPLHVTVALMSVASPSDIDEQYSHKFTGHWEDNASLAEDVNDWLATATSGWDTTVSCTATVDRLILHVDVSGTAPYVTVGITSLINAADPDSSTPAGWEWSTESGTGAADDPIEDRFAVGHSYRSSFVALVPRGSLGSTYWDGDERMSRTTSRVAWPENILFLTGRIATTGTPVLVAFPGGLQCTIDVTTTDATNRTVTGDLTFAAGSHEPAIWDGNTVPEIHAGLALTADAGVGSIMNVMEYITTNSVDFCNLGMIPMVTTADFDMTVAALEFGKVARGISYLNSRKYFIYKGLEFGKFLAEECKLAGLFVGTTGDGKLTFRAINHAVSTAPADIIVTQGYTIPNTFPSYERSPSGSINTVSIKTGYDPLEDDYTGSNMVVRDVTAFSHAKTSRVLSIEPKSAWTNHSTRTPDISNEDAVRIAQRVLGIFGRPYIVITVKVPMVYYTSAFLGCLAAFTNDHLPDNLDGTRGWTAAKPATVIGRRWDLGTGFGDLTLMLAAGNYAGYSPCLAITAPTGGGATSSFTATIDTAPINGAYKDWLPTGTDATDFFTVGDKIVVETWDSYTPTIRHGEVTSVTATTMGITTTSAWTPAAAYTYVIRFDQSDTAGTTESQKLFAYIARADTMLHRVSDTVQARQYL